MTTFSYEKNWVTNSVPKNYKGRKMLLNDLLVAIQRPEPEPTIYEFATDFGLPHEIAQRLFNEDIAANEQIIYALRSLNG